MRKAFDSLLGVVKGVLAEDPLSESLFVFVNRRKNSLKASYWDRTGFCLFAKRLERGRSRFPPDSPKQELRVQVFRLPLDGIELGRCLPPRFIPSSRGQDEAEGLLVRSYFLTALDMALQGVTS